MSSSSTDIETNSELAKNLKGRLMLVHGDIDNNVHPANTMRLADALIKANKRFDMLVLPGIRHGFAPVSGYVNWIRGRLLLPAPARPGRRQRRHRGVEPGTRAGRRQTAAVSWRPGNVRKQPRPPRQRPPAEARRGCKRSASAHGRCAARRFRKPRAEGPEPRGPRAEGPEPRGPRAEGPEPRGPRAEGPEPRRPRAEGPEP